MPVFAKCNVYISAIYRYVQTVFQYQGKLYIFRIEGLAIFIYGGTSYDAQHGKKALMPYANNEGQDERAHP